MKLNLGCGPKHLEGWTNCDINPAWKPDVLLNLSKPLPFDDNSVDEILLDNVMEHLDLDLTYLIIEFKRVLKGNGTLRIISPNCFFWKNRIKFLLGEFGPSSGYHYDHRWLFKPSFFKEFLIQYGFDCNKVNDLFDRDVVIVARKRL